MTTGVEELQKGINKIFPIFWPVLFALLISIVFIPSDTEYTKHEDRIIPVNATIEAHKETDIGQTQFYEVLS